MGWEGVIMVDLSWINGAVCAAFVAVPFVVLAAVGLRNARREARARLTVPGHPRRWRVTHVASVTHDAHGPR